MWVMVGMKCYVFSKSDTLFRTHPHLKKLGELILPSIMSMFKKAYMKKDDTEKKRKSSQPNEAILRKS